MGIVRLVHSFLDILFSYLILLGDLTLWIQVKIKMCFSTTSVFGSTH